MTAHVIALPGGVNPAALRYAPLQAALGTDVELHLKDLEVYSGDEPPAGYSVQMEVDAVGRFADSLRLERFHLLGYSGGGFVALAMPTCLGVNHPERAGQVVVAAADHMRFAIGDAGQADPAGGNQHPGSRHPHSERSCSDHCSTFP